MPMFIQIFLLSRFITYNVNIFLYRLTLVERGVYMYLRYTKFINIYQSAVNILITILAFHAIYYVNVHMKFTSHRQLHS